MAGTLSPPSILLSKEAQAAAGELDVILVGAGQGGGHLKSN